ncbi:hypothetical protein PPYR_14079 [Photinus pyralis]|uniref:Uncharacterized protein n=1 Tax=Photinus pyralis TaxID=7054 RepID=A0A5N4A495_PHOPY|nr:hypothetical protein PPYR_14079 [Photinus pyralis]
MSSSSSSSSSRTGGPLSRALSHSQPEEQLARILRHPHLVGRRHWQILVALLRAILFSGSRLSFPSHCWIWNYTLREKQQKQIFICPLVGFCWAFSQSVREDGSTSIYPH